MKITIYQNREVYKEESKIGNDSENKVETLEFEFPEEYEDFTKYIEFQIKGEKYTDIIENNKYEITRAIAKQGKIKTQVVLRKSIENDVLVFKSNVFELNVSKSINATENIPDEYPTWADNLTTLKQNLEKSEQERVTSEEARIEAEKQREETFTQMEQSVEDAVKEIADKKADYNQNALEKTNEYNELTEQKTNAFNSNTEIKTNNFNQNYTEKTTVFDTDVTTKMNEFNTNATNKTTEFNNNAKSKTETFNSIVEQKETELENLAEEKINEYNQVSAELTAKVEQVQAENESLKAENKLIKEQIPSASASGNSIHVEDSGTLDFDWKIKGGHKQATREGYNLFQINFASKTVGGVTIVTNEDKSIVANGTMTAAWLNFIQYDITDKLEDLETYTIWQKNYATGISGIYLQIRQIEIENPTKFVDYHSASKKVTFTVDKSKYKYTAILQTAGKTETFNNYTNAYMLYKGTEDKPYEQYGVSPSPDYPSEIETVNGSVEVDVVNKNLLDMKNAKGGESAGITCTMNKDGSYKYVGTATSKIINVWLLGGYNRGEVLFSLVPGTYYIDGVHLFYKNIEIADVSKKNIFTFTETQYVTGVRALSATIGETYNKTVYPIVTLSDTATDFVEHQSQTAIMPVQQEMLEGDYVADVEYHEWGKYVFTGEENYVKSSGYSDDKYFCGYIEKALPGLNMKGGSAAYCTHFKRFGMYNNILNEECINITIQFHVRILASHLTENSAEAFKSWLKSQYEAGTPVTIYYKLAKPLNLELTAEQKSIRDTKLYTYKNITNISLSDELASIDVTYKKDLETEHNKLQKEIDEIKQLISTTETSALLLDNLQKDVESEVE